MRSSSWRFADTSPQNVSISVNVAGTGTLTDTYTGLFQVENDLILASHLHLTAEELSASDQIDLVVWPENSLGTSTYPFTNPEAAWLANPVVAVLMVLLVSAAMYHAQLGMQVVYEDYIHTHWLKIAADVGTKFISVALAAAASTLALRSRSGAATGMAPTAHDFQ